MSSTERESQQQQEEDVCKDVELTSQEMAVLRECRMNSLYLRGFPLGIFSVLGTRFLAHNYLPHVKRWAGFYYTASFSMGVLVGVGSYKEKCLDKIMSLNDSRLADQVREFRRRAGAKNGQMSSVYDIHKNRQQQEGGEATGSNRGSYEVKPPIGGPRTSPRFGRFGRHENSDKDDNNQDGEDSTGSSYDELRRANRARQSKGPRRLPTRSKQEDEEQSEDMAPYDPDTSYDKRETYSAGLAWESDLNNQASDDQPDQPVNRGQWPKRAPVERTRKNKYGDEME